LNDYLEAKLHETLTLCQFSQIRLLGLGVAIVSFLKVVTLLSTSSSNPGVRATCILAIAYFMSYIILESLTWTLVEFPGRRSNRDIPLENLLPVVRYVDPGDDPFTFPHHGPAIASDIQLNNLANREVPNEEARRFPMNKGVMCMVGTLGLSGPAIWMLLLSHIWNPLTAGIILIVSLAVFVLLRLCGKLLYKRFFVDSMATVTVETAAIDSQTASNAPRGWDTRFGIFKLFVSVGKWIWGRVTNVNIFSTAWIILMSYYFGRVFQDTMSDEPVAKPDWMDWLG
jgi:hypothetical protein